MLQENSTRTEHSLRGVFSRATDCSPCVLLLRHLEALMHIAQAQDPTQGARSAIHILITDSLTRLRTTDCARDARVPRWAAAVLETHRVPIGSGWNH